MGWFDEQIRLRKEKDQEVFEDSFVEVAAAVLGERGASRFSDARTLAKEAIDQILKYYRFKPAEVPDSLKTLDEQLEYCLRPHGLMRRNVTLSPGWYRDSFGPLLAFRAGDSLPVALLPRGLKGYAYRDPTTGETVKVSRSNAGQFEGDAVCFYRPLPLGKIGIRDLLIYGKNTLTMADYVLLGLATLAVTLVGTLLPRMTQILTGPVMETGRGGVLLSMGVFMVTAAVSMQLLSMVRSLLMKRLKTKVTLSVEAAMMMRLMSLPAKFFRQFSAGELASRTQLVRMLCELLLENVLSVGLAALASLVYVAQIFQFAPALTVPALVIILATVTVTLAAALIQVRISRLHMAHGAKEQGMAFAMINGVQKIKLSGAEKRAFARWARVYAEGASYQYDKPTFLKIHQVLVTAIGLIGNIVLYYLATESGVAPASYLAFNTAYGAVTAAFSAMALVALSIAQIPPILEMAEPILSCEPEVADGKEVLTRLSGGIELSHVTFRYDAGGPVIIDDLSLKIRSGEYLAIVGSTGCGKSTLMRLLLGFETPEKGAIYYDGKDMARLDLRSLRRRIGAVTQDGGLFQGDIFSNITISAPQLTLDEAWEAAEIAGIADDIRRMPMGMHTIISEGQGGISGGQRQRLMIARAVAPKPKILLFDEATSALDNKTQKQVSQALDELKCTRVVIAHRLSTIRHCDRILVLEKGKILEQGTYEELVAKGGFFADLVERQRLDLEKA